MTRKAICTILLITILLLAASLACVGGGGGGGSGDPAQQTENAIATMGAELFHAQLTAQAEATNP